MQLTHETPYTLEELRQAALRSWKQSTRCSVSTQQLFAEHIRTIHLTVSYYPAGRVNVEVSIAAKNGFDSELYYIRGALTSGGQIRVVKSNLEGN